MYCREATLAEVKGKVIPVQAVEALIVERD
jgi:hypothetical protein